MKNKVIEYILVIIQFLTIGYLVISTTWASMGYWANSIIAFSALLAAWSIMSMKLDNLRIRPEPLENAKLIMKGPYKIIRHPMYSSLMLLAIPLVTWDYNLMRLLAGLLLITDLLVKLKYEEGLLIRKFPQYQSYMQHTSRIIPYIY
jgi:protein-S-isoprenylcysteine O-methyltransferase Ste14